MWLIIILLNLFGNKEISILWLLTSEFIMFARIFYYVFLQKEDE